MCQFGFRQDIPQPCDTGSALHATDRRDRGGYDWSVVHHSSVDLWTHRREHVIAGEPPTAATDMSVRAYMVWYSRITRRLIGPPVHTPPIGFQPMGSIVDILGHTLVQIHQIADAALADGTDVAHTQTLQTVRSLTSTCLEAVREDHRLHRAVHTEPLHIPHTAPRTPADVPPRPYGIVLRRQRPPRHRPDIRVDDTVDTVLETSVAERTSAPSGPQQTPSIVRGDTPSTLSPHQTSPHTTLHPLSLTETSIPSEYHASPVSPMAGPATFISDASGVTLPSLPLCHDALIPSPPTDVQISQPLDEVTHGHGIRLGTTPPVVHRSQHRATTPLAHLISLVRGRGRGQGRGSRYGGVRGRGGRERGGRGRGSGTGRGGDSIPVGDPVSQVCDDEPSQLQDGRPTRLRKKLSCGT